METICRTEKVLAALNKAGIQEYRPEDFAIFLGGNASKQIYVEELMREIFRHNKIERIRKASGADENLSDRYKLNSKTAVAFGQLNLDAYYIDKSTYQTGAGGRAPFPFNVGYMNGGTGEFVRVLEKANNSLDWVRCNRVSNGQIQIYFTSDPDCDPKTLKPLDRIIEFDADSKKNQLWIRVAPDAHNSIEYRIGTRKDIIDADQPMDASKVFELEE